MSSAIARTLALTFTLAFTQPLAHAFPLAFAPSFSETLALAFPRSLALAQSARRTIGAGTAIRADAAIFLQASRLAGGAFFLGLWRTAITFAVALISLGGSVLGEGGKRCSADH